MLHKIGTDYSELLTKRKTKKMLPLVGRLQRRVELGALQKEISTLLTLRGERPRTGFEKFDPASSEHNYHLKTTKGESFIRNYEEFYQQYSIIGFQELSEEAKKMASTLSYGVSELSPIERLRGMKNTNYHRYHPHYDERNYTSPSQFNVGAIKRLLESFKAQACRAALVCLRPQQYISPHFDLGPEYITRTMVPIFTNNEAVVGVRSGQGYFEYHLPADGGVYFINSGFEHYAVNGGNEARYQIRVCLNGQEDLSGMEELSPLRFVCDEEFANHPCAPEKKAETNAENILLSTLQEFNMEKSGKARLS